MNMCVYTEFYHRKFQNFQNFGNFYVFWAWVHFEELKLSQRDIIQDTNIFSDRNLEYLFCIRPIIDRFKFITSYSIYGANTTVKILTIFVA